MNRKLAAYHLARGFIEAEDSVLDIGCGGGLGTMILADRALYVVGVGDAHEMATGFEIPGFMEFRETIPSRNFEIAVAFGDWNFEDIAKYNQNAVTRRLITNRKVTCKDWKEAYSFDCTTPIIIYDREYENG